MHHPDLHAHPAGVLVACLGHYSPRPRNLAVKLLNALYDTVDWQLPEAHTATVATVGDPFVLSVALRYTLEDAEAAGEVFRVLVCAPPFEAGSDSGVVLTMHEPKVIHEEAWVPHGGSALSSSSGGLDEEAQRGCGGSVVQRPSYVRGTIARVSLTLASFPRPGFYDWRVVVVARDGSVRPVAAAASLSNSEAAMRADAGEILLPRDNFPVATPNSAAVNGFVELGLASPMVRPPRAETSKAVSTMAGVMASAAAASSSSLSSSMLSLAQGRFVVYPTPASANGEQAHEVIVDLEGMEFSPDGDIVRHGTFADVASRIPALRGAGVTSLVVLGAIERDNGWGEADAVDVTPAAVAADAALAPQLIGPAQTQLVSASALFARGGMRAVEAAATRGAASGVEALQLMMLRNHTSRRTTSVDSNGDDDFFFSDDSIASTRAAVGAVALDVPAVATTPSFGFNLPSGVRAHAARPDANPHAVVDRRTLNRMLGGSSAFAGLCASARTAGLRVLVQLDAAVSSSRPHRKYKHLYAYTLDTKGQAVTHHGTDALENQWEDTQLLNYRKVCVHSPRGCPPAPQHTQRICYTHPPTP